VIKIPIFQKSTAISELCSYLVEHKQNIDIRNPDIQKYILLDYVLNDSSKFRKEKRVSQINELLNKFTHFVDSAGVANLDAAPVRFYKSDTGFYRPFNANLQEAAPVSFAYFSKSNEKKPLGYLLFDEKTHKLIAWIMINQGGYYYYLEFTLI
jgi:hypothetical protein